ncbi:MFS transporter [Bifidobacterium tissieri]|uniref:MFS transporter n=1 Tax=Bifidobacterium tissieri TaxID=1630162 RepID=A0A261FGN4_9BIFI|nr:MULTISPECIES: MFS transporter [Bifidobacterium]OZG58302.1 MFS transporter [Bifidobacterium tissieri]TPF97076.1 hypothetical protein EP30_03795 [Bifidobacterium sp. UTCIF-39]
MFSKIGKKRKITLWTRIGFGMGGMLSSGALTFTHTYMVLFISTEAGLSAGEAAIIASAAIYLDAILAPLMGFISDNFYNTRVGRRFGRRRFWILLAIPMMVAEPLIFLVTPFGFGYYLLCYIVYNIGYSFASTSLGPLTIEMTDNFEERSYLTGTKHLFGNVTGFLMAFLVAFGFGIFGENNPHSYFIIACINASIMVIALLGVYLSTWERTPEEVAQEKIANVGEAIKKLFIDIFSTFRNRSFRRILYVQMSAKFAANVWSACYSYFIVFTLGIPKSFASASETPGKVVAIVCIAVWIAWLAKKGFHQPWYAAVLGAATCMAVFIGLGVGQFTDMIPVAAVMVAYPIVFAVWKFFYAGFQYLPDVPLNYVPDIDELITLRRREGIYSSAQRLVNQLVQGLITTVFGFLLLASGFISTKDGQTVEQPITVPITVSLTLLVGCCCMFVLSAFFARNLKIDKDTCDIVTGEVERVKAGGLMKDVDPKVKAVCEELSGLPYEQCFAHNTIGYQEEEIKPAA